MAEFEKAIGYVLDNEGGFSDDPADTGHATRYGITAAEAQRHGLDVTTLTIDNAKAIYEKDYWRFDAIADQRVATKLFDMAVNMGLATAVRMAQKIAAIAYDGIMGPLTANCINNVPTDRMLSGLVAASVRRYAAIVAANASQSVFIVGWMERALKLP